MQEHSKKARLIANNLGGGGQKTVRQSNLEFLRILSMLFIVANHYAFHGGSVFEGSNMPVAYFIGGFSQIGVALFVMIGAWFLVDKEFSINRVFKLWKQIFFYSLGIALLVYFLFPTHCSLSKLVFSAFPLVFRSYWFCVPYVFLLLLHPFINRLLYSCDKNHVRTLCVLLFILQSIIPSVFIGTDSFGSQITHFVFYYVLVYALKRGYITLKFKHTYMFFVVSFLGAMFSYFFSIAMLYTSHVGKAFVFADNMASVPVLISTVCLFVGMTKISFKSRIINLIAGSTFAVYLISEHPYLFSWFWVDVLHTNELFNAPVFTYIFQSTIIIFAAFSSCILIDLVLKHSLYRVMDLIRIPKSIAEKCDHAMNYQTTSNNG